MKKIFGLSIVLAAVFIGHFSSLAGAQNTERILSFDSSIEIKADSSLLVTEKIKVVSQGKKIKRGIYRDFPTRYKDHYGINYVVGFDIINITRDGKKEPYHTKPLSNGIRIYIGHKDYYLASGQYTYTITYRTNRQLGFFKDHDELYWNVTGNGWDFPIMHASATVQLPEGAERSFLAHQAYTGYQGSREQAAIVERDAFGRLYYETTRKLKPHEGLTIVASWPKGYVTPPSSMDKVQYFLDDNRGNIVGLLGVLVILGYYLYFWHLVGRDPKKGTIIPLFHPPAKFSPAAMRYIYKMAYDNKAFTASVLNMAVKGYLEVEEREGIGILNIGRTYTIKRRGHDISRLTIGEKAVDRMLLGSDNEITLKQENHVIIRAAINGLQRTLKKEVETVYFLTNSKYFGFGLLATIIFFIVTFSFLANGGSPLILFPCWFLVVATNVIFYHLLKAPTLKGRKMMDQIEGFKMFLSVTEKDRLNLLNPPEKTPELFEKYLPYALALDVEQKWAQQFSDVFARLAQEGQGYYPRWYAGRSWDRFNTRGFASSLGSSFSGAIASSSQAPGSSSGFGGGSGGGGGGGGGGGW